jgi:hypothetical protein
MAGGQQASPQGGNCLLGSAINLRRVLGVGSLHKPITKVALKRNEGGMTQASGRESWWRARLFWLGMPGMVFLLWAWWMSNRCASELVHEPSGTGATNSHGRLLIHQIRSAADGTVSFWLDRREGRFRGLDEGWGGELFLRPAMLEFPSLGFHEIPIPTVDRVWFRSPRWQSSDEPAGSSYRLLAIPYWLLLTGYFGIWSGMIVRWQKRRRGHTVSE